MYDNEGIELVCKIGLDGNDFRCSSERLKGGYVGRVSAGEGHDGKVTMCEIARGKLVANGLR